MTSSIVVFHADADEARAVLEPRLSREQVHYVDNPKDIATALGTHQPEVAFTLKSAGMPGPALRQVMLSESVRWVYVGGSGYDHLLPLDNPQIRVSNAAGVLAPHLAETVTGAILALNGNFLRYRDQQLDRSWTPQRFVPLNGRTLLVVGLGHIGELVARNAKHLGMRVLATRRRVEPHPHVDAVHTTEALYELLPEADFVSLHVRLTPDTHHLFDESRFSRMRPGSYFINTARGPVADEAALVRALDQHLAGAYLDVFETEPLPGDSPLWHRPDVLVTPHAADNIVGWEQQFLAHFADNVQRFRSGEPVQNLVPTQA